MHNLYNLRPFGRIFIQHLQNHSLTSLRNLPTHLPRLTIHNIHQRYQIRTPLKRMPPHIHPVQQHPQYKNITFFCKHRNLFFLKFQQFRCSEQIVARLFFLHGDIRLNNSFYSVCGVDVNLCFTIESDSNGFEAEVLNENAVRVQVMEYSAEVDF